MREDLLSVSYQSDAVKPQAEAFARQHQLTLTSPEQASTPLLLHYSEDFVELRDRDESTAIHVDFLKGDMAHRKQFGGGRGQSIAKAIGLKSGVQPPSVLDATAGLARDAYVLASLGCAITMLEQSPVVAELVQQAIDRASENADFQLIQQQGFKLINDNAIHYMQQLAEHEKPDVVYLDPMFPERKKSAQVKKNMQILQKLLGHGDDIESLLDIALSCALKRVVVKRPKGAPCIGEHKPSMAIETKKMRYDVYVNAAMKAA